MSLQLVSLGECLVEFNQTGDGTWSPGFAGDAFNALFYATRLGLATGFISAVGDDPFTPMILSGIEGEGIDTTHLLRFDGYRNGIYFIELDEHAECTFHFWRNGSAATKTLLHHDIEKLAGYVASSEYFLLSGITLAVMEAPERLMELLRRVHRCTQIVLDSNYRARLWRSPEEYRRRIEQVLPYVDIFLPTAGDLMVAYRGESLEAACKRGVDSGVATVVVKCGNEGCAYWSDGSLHHIPAIGDVEVVDTTGAGDAFNAGFLTGSVRGYTLEESCALGQQVASRALGVKGAIDWGFAPDDDPVAPL